MTQQDLLIEKAHQLPEIVDFEFYGLSKMVKMDNRYLSNSLPKDWGRGDKAHTYNLAMLILRRLKISNPLLIREFNNTIIQNIRYVKPDPLYPNRDKIETSFKMRMRMREAILALLSVYTEPKELSYFLEYSDIQKIQVSAPKRIM